MPRLLAASGGGFLVLREQRSGSLCDHHQTAQGRKRYQEQGSSGSVGAIGRLHELGGRRTDLPTPIRGCLSGTEPRNPTTSTNSPPMGLPFPNSIPVTIQVNGSGGGPLGCPIPQEPSSPELAFEARSKQMSIVQRPHFSEQTNHSEMPTAWWVHMYGCCGHMKDKKSQAKTLK